MLLAAPLAPPAPVFPLFAPPRLIWGSFRAWLVPRSLPLPFLAQARCRTTSGPVRLGLRAPVFQPLRKLHNTLPTRSLALCWSLCPTPPCLPRHGPPVALVSLPAASVAASWCFFFGGGRGRGGGEGSIYGQPSLVTVFVTSSPGVCTLRALYKHVARHRPVGGGGGGLFVLSLAPSRLPVSPGALVGLPSAPFTPAPPPMFCGGGGGCSLVPSGAPSLLVSPLLEASTMQAQCKHNHHTFTTMFPGYRRHFLSTRR